LSSKKFGKYFFTIIALFEPLEARGYRRGVTEEGGL